MLVSILYLCHSVYVFVCIDMCLYFCVFMSVCVCVSGCVWLCVGVCLCAGGRVSVWLCIHVCHCISNHRHVRRVWGDWVPPGVESYSFFFPVNRKQRNLFLKFYFGPQNVNFMWVGLQSRREECAFWRSSLRKPRIHYWVANFSDYSTVRHKACHSLYMALTYVRVYTVLKIILTLTMCNRLCYFKFFSLPFFKISAKLMSRPTNGTWPAVRKTVVSSDPTP